MNQHGVVKILKYINYTVTSNIDVELGSCGYWMAREGIVRTKYKFHGRRFVIYKYYHYTWR